MRESCDRVSEGRVVQFLSAESAAKDRPESQRREARGVWLGESHCQVPGMQLTAISESTTMMKGVTWHTTRRPRNTSERRAVALVRRENAEEAFFIVVSGAG